MVPSFSLRPTYGRAIKEVMNTNDFEIAEYLFEGERIQFQTKQLHFVGSLKEQTQFLNSIFLQ